ncbi:hypothetical protein EVAR_94876_1 [Eumeta japonica]|uniref:Uncharacterized protein n=1 Tax=Eumeta variegata TaxID=151549 RepID=A0A4C1VCS9_EUMVA|nr:hypothetical protein EVAR_94876_1 [Eumeta japonica]
MSGEHLTFYTIIQFVPSVSRRSLSSYEGRSSLRVEGSHIRGSIKTGSNSITLVRQRRSPGGHDSHDPSHAAAAPSPVMTSPSGSALESIEKFEYVYMLYIQDVKITLTKGARANPSHPDVILTLSQREMTANQVKPAEGHSHGGLKCDQLVCTKWTNTTGEYHGLTEYGRKTAASAVDSSDPLPPPPHTQPFLPKTPPTHCCEVRHKSVAMAKNKYAGKKKDGSGSVMPAQYIIRSQSERHFSCVVTSLWNIQWSGRRRKRRLTYQTELEYHKLLIKKKEEEYNLKFQLMREKHEAELLVLAEERECFRLEQEKIKALLSFDNEAMHCCQKEKFRSGHHELDFALDGHPVDGPTASRSPLVVPQIVCRENPEAALRPAAHVQWLKQAIAVVMDIYHDSKDTALCQTDEQRSFNDRVPSAPIGYGILGMLQNGAHTFPLYFHPVGALGGHDCT